MGDRHSTAKVGFRLLTPNFPLFMNKKSQRYFSLLRSPHSSRAGLLALARRTPRARALHSSRAAILARRALFARAQPAERFHPSLFIICVFRLL